MSQLPFLLSALLLVLLGSAPSTQDASSESRPRWAVPALERAVSVRDGRTGTALTFTELLDVLATADAVFLGEFHTDETTHRVELAVYEGLANRRAGKVVLAMEMFERDVQAALDLYLTGGSSESEFLAASRPWGNYDTAYRPLIEFAKKSGLSVVASNFPQPLRRSLAMMGAEASLDGLDESVRMQAPMELLPNSPAYWRRVDNAIRGHLAMMGGSRGADERLYSTQSLWDNSMGEACAIALDEHPGSSVLHVNGGFHSAYWDGTVRQLRLRKPEAKILTVSVVPVSNPSVADPGGIATADYVVYAEARAADRNEGAYTVHVQQDVEYRLHLPEDVAEDSTVPLLIWFSDDGLKAEDGIELWRSRLGTECAIAVVEAPYREIQDDLVDGGRWFWPDSFREDTGFLLAATEGMWGYLLRHYPIDPNRVCVAGEGTGATIVAALCLMDDRLNARSVAFSPRRYADLKDLSLPLPELRGDDVPADRSLRVSVGPNDESWWTKELAEYSTVGLRNTLAEAPQDPWLLEADRESALRQALGLPEQEALPTGRRHILADGRRAHHWARLMAVALSDEEAVVAVVDRAPADGSSTPISTTIDPRGMEGEVGIPPCPGSFGGTTVVVLPEGLARETVDAWLALEENDPLNKKNRFQRLRVATAEGERGLPHVLAKLREENRNNVLVVPATFCADSLVMRALQRSVGDLEDTMTLHWLPGLGRAAVDSLTE